MKTIGMGKIIAKAVVLLFVILLSVLFIGPVKASGAEPDAHVQSIYYHELESRFREVLEYELQKEGMENAGINISCITDISGNRTVTVSVHHYKIDRMSENEKTEFIGEISSVGFADDSITVVYELI